MRSLLFNLFFYGFTGLVALTAWAVARFGSRERLQAVIGFWGRTVRAAVALILESRVEVRGLGNLPAGGTWLLVCKHQSELDAVMLASLIPHSGAVAMQELENYPLFGPVLHRLGFVLVSVSGPRQNMTAQVVQGAQRIFAEGRPLVIFPEATLMSLGARERYRKGIGHIYAACDVPVVPVASCLGAIWPRREWKKHAHQTAAIEALEPIPPGLPMDRFMALIEERIETATMRLIREHATGAALAAAEDRHARGVANED
jgi:1-acyl-sn-glycerol-3-phosphate acyltransferase